MGQARETIRDIIVPAGGKIRVWDAPISMPLKDLYIWASTRGSKLSLALDWEVFYGGGWTGSPFGENDREGVAPSAHKGGVSQGTGSFAAAAELATMFYSDLDHLPGNRIAPTPPQPVHRAPGFPIVVELDNTLGGTPVKITIIFLTQVVTDRY